MAKKKKVKIQSSVSRKRRQEEAVTPSYFLENNKVIKLSLFCVFAVLLISVCFVGQFPTGLQVFPNQVAKIRIIADFPFSYESQIKTKQREEILRRQIAPIFSVDDILYSRFQENILKLETKLDELSVALEGKPNEERHEQVNKFMEDYENETDLYVSGQDVDILLQRTQKVSRRRLFDEGLIVLKDVAREGIFEPVDGDMPEDEAGRPLFYSIQIDGRRNVHVQSHQEALRTLNINIGTLDADWILVRAMFRILKQGIKPNLVYDSEKTEAKIETAIEGLGPVIVDVKYGQTIIEPGSIIGPEQLEQLKEYHNSLNRNESMSFGLNIAFAERSLFALAILLSAVIYVQLGLPELLQSNRRLALVALVILLNLVVIRLILELGDSDLLRNSPHILSVLPFIVPTALGPMLIAILLNTRTAVLVAAIISTFVSVMLGNVTGIFLIALLSSFVGIYFCQDIRLRTKVMKAGAMTGIVVAIGAFLVGFLNENPKNMLAYQMLFSFITGILSSIAVVAILPLLENLFKLTSNITLLELTDFNHPLLRRLQLEAPGTYHHSLMVANLSERAAVEVGANPLVCRVGALFHDIGKLAKPEYFSENQTAGMNPHVEKNPSMSALVIKSHIKEGVSLARKFKLPRLITDIIWQHHGTTLIQYFFVKAIKKKRQPQLSFGDSSSDFDSEEEVEESTFRYDGPRPRFVESAIVFFADSLEAASRTLKKVSASSIEELVNVIFKEKLEDHQLDDCPVNLQQIRLMKESFSFTLLNMLHSRTEYPNKGGREKTSGKEGNSADDKDGQALGTSG